MFFLCNKYGYPDTNARPLTEKNVVWCLSGRGSKIFSYPLSPPAGGLGVTKRWAAINGWRGQVAAPWVVEECGSLRRLTSGVLYFYLWYNLTLYSCSESEILTLYHLNFFFHSFSGRKPKIGSFRLPTHSRDAHRKFFWWSLLKLKS